VFKPSNEVVEEKIYNPNENIEDEKLSF